MKLSQSESPILSKLLPCNIPNIFGRLGTFHLLMSFLGSIGKLMKGSGLEQAFEQVYAPNSVPSMMSGKKIARALRAHTLAYSALMSLLLDEVPQEGAYEGLKLLYSKALKTELWQDEIHTCNGIVF